MLAVVEDVGVTGGCMLGVMVSVIQLILCHFDVLAKLALNNCLLATSITLLPKFETIVQTHRQISGGGLGQLSQILAVGWDNCLLPATATANKMSFTHHRSRRFIDWVVGHILEIFKKS